MDMNHLLVSYPNLLHRHTLRQIPRLIHVIPTASERNRPSNCSGTTDSAGVNNRQRVRNREQLVDRLVQLRLRLRIAMPSTCAPRAFTSLMLLTVFSTAHPASPARSPEYLPRSAPVYRASVHRPHSLGVDVRNFLQLQRPSSATA